MPFLDPSGDFRSITQVVMRARDLLGSTHRLATHLNVSTNQLMRWVLSEDAVPEGITRGCADLDRLTAQELAQIMAALTARLSAALDAPPPKR
jgi:hypothetical protein